MIEESTNPQNLADPVQYPDLTGQKPIYLNSRKKILIIFIFILLLIIPASIFLYLTNSRPSIVPPPFPLPKTTEIPNPTTETGEYIITIKLGETKTIPNSVISLTYKSADIPGENCIDCITSNVIEAKMDDQSIILDYSCGGFTGECISKLGAYGFEVEVIDSSVRDLLKLKIVRN